MTEVTRKSPFWLAPPQDYTNNHLNDNHSSAIYSVGEYVIFFLMWRAVDLEAGRVGRCSNCYLPRVRIAEAYKQAADAKCPNCFGTSYEGGFRARIIRPAVISDKNTATIMAKHGEVITDSVSLETTSDFVIRTGDYLVRADGTRYLLEEMSTLVVRSGFSLPTQNESISGLVSSARLEDPSSVCYLIPPLADEANELLLALALDRHSPRDVTELDVLRGPLIV